MHSSERSNRFVNTNCVSSVGVQVDAETALVYSR